MKAIFLNDFKNPYPLFMNDYKGYGKYMKIRWPKEVGTLKMDYCVFFFVFFLSTIGGCDCQIKRIFHYRHEKSYQTSEVVCGQQFHSCCLVSSDLALFLISCLCSRGTEHLI